MSISSLLRPVSPAWASDIGPFGGAQMRAILRDDTDLFPCKYPGTSLRVRLWSLHPKYLDQKGLVALWREGLLGRHVLLGLTCGYRNHPQLIRFKSSRNPIAHLDSYLSRVFDQAKERGYLFDVTKIDYRGNCRMSVTTGQLRYEWEHLRRKLATRDPDWLQRSRTRTPEPHPCFRVVQGPIEAFERPV